MSKGHKAKKAKKGLRLFWMPNSAGHKHKRNKYYVRPNYNTPESAMMSGDSPTTHDLFDFPPEGRRTPPPTTSKDIGSTEAKTDIVAASVMVEPPKGGDFVGVLDEDKTKDDEILASEERSARIDGHQRDDGDRKEATKQLNGNKDKLDGNWVPVDDLKKEDEEYDDNCAVKCLYYTLQCCECTVM